VAARNDLRGQGCCGAQSRTRCPPSPRTSLALLRRSASPRRLSIDRRAGPTEARIGPRPGITFVQPERSAEELRPCLLVLPSAGPRGADCFYDLGPCAATPGPLNLLEDEGTTRRTTARPDRDLLGNCPACAGFAGGPEPSRSPFRSPSALAFTTRQRPYVGPAPRPTIYLVYYSRDLWSGGLGLRENFACA